MQPVPAAVIVPVRAIRQPLASVTMSRMPGWTSSAARASSSGDSVTPGEPPDQDGDGLITVLDARICVLQCTAANCAEPVVRGEPGKGSANLREGR